ncbi:28086_t:CDS:2, partial [Racocetra persica]
MKSSQLFFIIFGLLAFTSINSPVLANNYGLDVKCESAGTNLWDMEFSWTSQETVAQQDDQIEQQQEQKDSKDSKDSKEVWDSKNYRDGKGKNNKDDKNVVVLIVCKNLGYYDSVYGKYRDGKIKYNMYGRKSWKNWFGHDSWKRTNDKYYDGDNYFGDNQDDYDSCRNDDYRGGDYGNDYNNNNDGYKKEGENDGYKKEGKNDGYKKEGKND